MLNLGIIGTGTITHQFIEACQLAGEYRLSAVYSRQLETAQQFAQPYGDIALFTDLEPFVSSPIDVVYLATPNSLHYTQALTILNAGKHLIVEKPAFSNPAEFNHIIEVANQHHVMVFEAARNYHERNFDVIKHVLADKTIYGATFNFAQYSSRMKHVRQGIYDNIFQSNMSGGALVDLGIYEIYAAYKLFGQPNTARYSADILPTGVDISGSGQLIYDDFQVTLVVRKNANSNLISEIYTDKGTLVLNHIQCLDKATFYPLEGNPHAINLSPAQHAMVEEARHFATILNNPKHYQDRYHHLLTTAKHVNDTLTTMRQDAGIHFKADKEH